MAVKKVTSRTRSTTTKRSKSTTASAGKRVAKPRGSAAKRPANAVETPSMETPEVAEVPVISPAPAVAPSAAGRTTEVVPSRYTGDHYLHAAGPEQAEGAVRRPGKWLIFVSRSRVDALWNTIRRAVEKGRLGHAAKVSTALPNPLSPDPKKHVICVYTADQENAADVHRVRAALRELGVSWKIPYKADAPGNGQHEWTGGPAAKYYE